MYYFKTIIINKIINKLAKPEMLKDLICDEHGNYIVQKALIHSKDNEEIFSIIINNIKKNEDLLKNDDDLRQKIYEKLKKNYGQFLDSNENKEDNKEVNKEVIREENKESNKEGNKEAIKEENKESTKEPNNK